MPGLSRNTLSYDTVVHTFRVPIIRFSNHKMRIWYIDRQVECRTAFLLMCRYIVQRDVSIKEEDGSDDNIEDDVLIATIV